MAAPTRDGTTGPARPTRTKRAPAVGGEGAGPTGAGPDGHLPEVAARPVALRDRMRGVRTDQDGRRVYRL